MKLIKQASGKTTIKLSRREWENFGKKAGWIKMAQQTRDTSLDGPLMTDLAHLRTRLAGLDADALTRQMSGSTGTQASILKTMIDEIRTKYNRSHRINDTGIAHFGSWLGNLLEGRIDQSTAMSQFSAQSQNALSSINETMEWLENQRRVGEGMSQQPTTNQWS